MPSTFGWPLACFGAFHVLTGMMPSGRPKFGGPADWADVRSYAAVHSNALANAIAVQVYVYVVSFIAGSPGTVEPSDPWFDHPPAPSRSIGLYAGGGIARSE